MANRPGPDDLGGYRLERRRDGTWSTIVPQTRSTTYLDTGGHDGDGYRLYVSNGLGQEFYLGQASDGTAPALGARLNVWPVPYRGGDLRVSFPTGAAGGVAAPAEVIVYDVAGRQVAVLERGEFAVGVRTITWDGRGADGQPVQSLEYNDKWFDLTDGSGFSLTLIDPADPRAVDSKDKDLWRASADVGGSPGWDDSWY